MHLCGVSVVHLEESDTPMDIYTSLLFKSGSSCSESYEEFYFRVVRSDGAYPWLIDGAEEYVSPH